jgi:hypothetical protein
MIFRFILLEARFPELYQEARNKIAGGVKPIDIIADWLNELACYRRGITMPLSVEVQPAGDIADDIDFAKDVMASLD